MTVTTRRLASGFAWVALANYSNRFFGLVTTLILAKVLTPHDFGLVAIASMLIEVIQIFKDMGLSEAVIYNKREDMAAIDTAHTILVGYNVILFLLAALMAPFAARFYENPTVLPIIVVMSSNLVINSLRSVPRTLIRKNLDYGKLVIPETVPVAVSSAVSILMALTGFGVWSLVAKTVLHNVLGLALLQFIVPYRGRFAFDRAAARELFHYGRFIIGTTMLLVVLYNVDKFYISKFAGIAMLGLYDLALRIAELPVKQLSFLVGNVMFPVFSKIERREAALRQVFMKTLKYTASLTIPLAIGLALFGPPLVRLVYGDRWTGVGDVLRVLALYAALRSLSSIIHDLFKATGNPQLMQRACALRLVFIGGLGIPVLSAFGVVGLSALMVVTYSGTLSWELKRLAELLKTPLRSVVAPLVSAVVLSMTTLPPAYFLLQYLTRLDTLVELMAGIVAASIAYLAATVLVDRETAGDLLQIRHSLRRASPALDTAGQ